MRSRGASYKISFGTPSAKENIRVVRDRGKQEIILSRDFLTTTSKSDLHEILPAYIEDVFPERRRKLANFVVSVYKGCEGCVVPVMEVLELPLRSCTVRLENTHFGMLQMDYIASLISLSQNVFIQSSRIFKRNVLKRQSVLMTELIRYLRGNEKIQTQMVRFEEINHYRGKYICIDKKGGRINCMTNICSFFFDSLSCSTVWFARSLSSEADSILWAAGTPSKHAISLHQRLSRNRLFNFQIGNIIQHNLKYILLKKLKLDIVHLLTFEDLCLKMNNEKAVRHTLAAMQLNIAPFAAKEDFGFEQYPTYMHHTLINLIYRGKRNLQLSATIVRRFAGYYRGFTSRDGLLGFYETHVCYNL